MTELTRRIETLVRSATRRAVEEIEPIASGLGAQRYFRVRCTGGTSVVARVQRDVVTGSGPEPPLEPIRAFLEDAGLPVPRSYLHSEDIDLLEDLGDTSLLDRATDGLDDAVRALYAEACALLPRLQSLSAPASAPQAFQRRWIDFVPLKRARTLSHSLPAWLGRSPRPAERECLNAAFDTIEQVLRDAPLRLAHRDFQSSNLMVPAASSHPIAMIDLQGAFLAPPEYDLVCLLRDSYVVLPDSWVRELCETTRHALPDAPEASVFARRFNLLCVARKAKDDAFFLEALRRGDARYAAYRDANRRYLARASNHLAREFPCFEGWCEWFAAASGESAQEPQPCAQ